MILAVTNQKGGIGKTTISTSLAVGLAKKNKKVLFIDLDPQSNSSTLLLPGYEEFKNKVDVQEATIYTTIIDRQPIPYYDSKYENLAISPSHLLLAGADNKLAVAQDHREQRLKKQLDQIKSSFDEVIIDCPPNLGILPINAFVAAEKFLVVVEPGTFSFNAVAQLQEIIEDLIKKEYEHNIELLGFVFNKKSPTDVSKSTYLEIKKIFGDLVLKTVIPRNTDIEKAQYSGQSIFDYNSSAPAAQAFNDLISELYNL